MRDAAVGFHCPGCVAEGAKATRSGRTPYGGLRPTNASVTSITLIGINVFVWVTVLATGWRDSWLISRLALLPVGECESRANPGQFYNQLRSADQCASLTNTAGDGRWVPGVGDGAYWQLLTSAFSHVQLWHIGFNMLALWVLGPQLELVLGRVRFLALYFLSALAGSALVYWASGESSATLGASGAIFGLLGALLVVAYKARGDVRGILTWLGINAVFTLFFPNVSWQGHLGGFLGGALVAAVLVYAPRGPKRARFQVAGLVAVTALLALAIVARSVVLA